MGTKIVELRYNWRPCGNNQDGFDADYECCKLGINGVIKISDMTPGGDPGYTGACFFRVEFDNGDAITIFNPNIVKEVEI